MHVTETLSEGLKRAYTVVVDASDIEGKRTSKLTELGRTVRLPGFRPGKVPMPVMKQRYGTAVMAEVLEESVDEATRQVLSDRGLRPAMQPRVTPINLDPGAKGAARDLEFKVELELLPEITLPDFSSVHLTRLKGEVPPETIDNALNELAARQRTMEPVTSRSRGRPRPATSSRSTTRAASTAWRSRRRGRRYRCRGWRRGVHSGLHRADGRHEPGRHAHHRCGHSLSNYRHRGARRKGGDSSRSSPRPCNRAALPAVEDERWRPSSLASTASTPCVQAVTLTSRSQREYDQQSRHAAEAGTARRAWPTRSPISPGSAEGMAKAEFEPDLDPPGTRPIEAAGTLDADDAGQGRRATLARQEYQAIARPPGAAGPAAVGDRPDQRHHRRPRGNGAGDARTRPRAILGMEAQIMEMYRTNPQRFAESLHGPLFEDKVVDYILELAQRRREASWRPSRNS